MRAVVQRVSRGCVSVAGEKVSEIGRGLLIFLGIASGDNRTDVIYTADKISGLRIFEDNEGKMNLALAEVGGEILCISQFTLYGDCRKGKRPSFKVAALPSEAEKLYDDFCCYLVEKGFRVAKGSFGMMMQVMALNDGPVTLLIDSRKLF